MRVGIVADTHGVLDARVLRAVSGADLVVHAGDVGAARVLDALAAATGRVVAVRGNNDVPRKWADDERAVLDALPATVEVPLPGGLLVVVHGDRVLPAKQRHARLRAAWPAARLVVYGHSHRLCVDRDADPWVANPGAAGRARTFGGPSLLMLRAGEDRWELRRRRFLPAA